MREAGALGSRLVRADTAALRAQAEADLAREKQRAATRAADVAAQNAQQERAEASRIERQDVSMREKDRQQREAIVAADQAREAADREAAAMRRADAAQDAADRAAAAARGDPLGERPIGGGIGGAGGILETESARLARDIANQADVDRMRAEAEAALKSGLEAIANDRIIVPLIISGAKKGPGRIVWPWTLQGQLLQLDKDDEKGITVNKFIAQTFPTDKFSKEANSAVYFEPGYKVDETNTWDVLVIKPTLPALKLFIEQITHPFFRATYLGNGEVTYERQYIANGLSPLLYTLLWNTQRLMEQHRVRGEDAAVKMYETFIQFIEKAVNWIFVRLIGGRERASAERDEFRLQTDANTNKLLAEQRAAVGLHYAALEPLLEQAGAETGATTLPRDNQIGAAGDPLFVPPLIDAVTKLSATEAVTSMRDAATIVAVLQPNVQRMQEQKQRINAMQALTDAESAAIDKAWAAVNAQPIIGFKTVLADNTPLASVLPRIQDATQRFSLHGSQFERAFFVNIFQLLHPELVLRDPSAEFMRRYGISDRLFADFIRWTGLPGAELPALTVNSRSASPALKAITASSPPANKRAAMRELVQAMKPNAAPELRQLPVEARLAALASELLYIRRNIGSQEDFTALIMHVVAAYALFSKLPLSGAAGGRTSMLDQFGERPNFSLGGAGGVQMVVTTAARATPGGSPFAIATGAPIAAAGASSVTVASAAPAATPDDGTVQAASIFDRARVMSSVLKGHRLAPEFQAWLRTAALPVAALPNGQSTLEYIDSQTKDIKVTVFVPVNRLYSVAQKHFLTHEPAQQLGRLAAYYVVVGEVDPANKKQFPSTAEKHLLTAADDTMVMKRQSESGDIIRINYSTLRIIARSDMTRNGRFFVVETDDPSVAGIAAPIPTVVDTTPGRPSHKDNAIVAKVEKHIEAGAGEAAAIAAAAAEDEDEDDVWSEDEEEDYAPLQVGVGDVRPEAFSRTQAQTTPAATTQAGEPLDKYGREPARYRHRKNKHNGKDGDGKDGDGADDFRDDAKQVKRLLNEARLLAPLQVSGASSVTLFAPSKRAFAKARDLTTGDLREVLAYHIISGDWSHAKLLQAIDEQRTVKTLANRPLTLTRETRVGQPPQFVDGTLGPDDFEPQGRDMLLMPSRKTGGTPIRVHFIRRVLMPQASSLVMSSAPIAAAPATVATATKTPSGGDIDLPAANVIASAAGIAAAPAVKTVTTSAATPSATVASTSHVLPLVMREADKDKLLRDLRGAGSSTELERLVNQLKEWYTAPQLDSTLGQQAWQDALERARDAIASNNLVSGVGKREAHNRLRDLQQTFNKTLQR